MISTSNISLKVPFSEKDQAKSLGARWNAKLKHWYVPQGIDVTPFENWLTSSLVIDPAPFASKPVAKSDAENNQSFDDDLDAINAKLRDAYEPRNGDIF